MTASSPKSAPGSPAVVDVYADVGSDGSLAFSHEWRWENGPSEGKGSINVPKRAEHEPGTPIHFHLHDQTTSHLNFSDDALGAIWVSRTGCPETAASDDEIPQQGIEVHPKLLKLFNANNEECVLHYCLRFTSKDGQTESYDPEIKNGGKS